MTEEQGTIESIGARLHKARLKKKVTVDQVYKDIKVHPKVITALEEDRYSDFLNPTYIKAFLKSYCRYLELDCNRLLADYDKCRAQSAGGDKKEEAQDTRAWEKPKMTAAID
ncbi:MAG: helix-turn-helix domain-containing protein, partial [Candidatus Omnitrophica bacterium]|nr:helix-turn-helix domain-containing protein [Candidatus Omnitrophota bacterium]